MTVPTYLVYALIVAALVGIITPPLLAFYLNRKLRAGWRWIWYGALVYLVAEIVNAAVFRLAPITHPDAFLGLGRLNLRDAVYVSLLAGVGEEALRYLGYLLFFRAEDRTWNNAVMYGLGHGGLELMADKTIRTAFVVAVLLVTPHLRPGEAGQTPETVAVMVALWKKAAAFRIGGIVWTTAARIGALAVQIYLAVLVLQVFRRANVAWLFLAVGFHAAVDFSTALSPYPDVVGLVWAVVCLGLLPRLRDDSPSVNGAMIAAT